MTNVVVENKRMIEEMMARVWELYDRVPPEHKRKAQQLIDEWHEGKRSYEETLQLLKLLALLKRQARTEYEYETND